MDQLAAKSNALLESLAAARETERAAMDEAARARADLVVLDARLESPRARSCASGCSRSIPAVVSDSDIALMIEAMAAEPEDGRRPPR